MERLDKNIHLTVGDTLLVTVYNAVLVCIFGYGIVEKGMSPYHWLTYIGVSFVFFVFLGGIRKWDTESPDI